VEETHRQRAVLPQRAFRTEFDFLDRVEIDVLYDRRRRPRRRRVRRGRALARQIAQALVTERLRRAEAQALRARNGAAAACKRDQAGAEADELTTIDGNG